MTKTVRDVMTATPVQLDTSSTVTEAATAMRNQNIGTVVVTEGGSPKGIVTDRDIVVRAIAGGSDPRSTSISEICSTDLATVAPGTMLNEAVDIMRSKALRRLPVLENGAIIGIVSIGDFAIELDSRSALADISAAAPNS
jgi:signal-transduction protein with cAMP-binding, CBS, and nucleotidyltransferase domain